MKGNGACLRRLATQVITDAERLAAVLVKLHDENNHNSKNFVTEVFWSMYYCPGEYAASDFEAVVCGIRFWGWRMRHTILRLSYAAYDFEAVVCGIRF